MRGREAFVTALVLASLAAAPAAHAACDRPVVTAHATGRQVTAHATGGQAPLAIGDSTMLFAVKYLAERGISSNARECRSWTEGLGVVRRYKRRGQLPPDVIMALGANSWVRPIDVRRALKLIGPKRTLWLATHRTWFGKPGPDTGVIRRMAKRYRKRVKLIDWVRYAAPHPDWFNTGGYDDGLHPNQVGAREFADFIARRTLG